MPVTIRDLSAKLGLSITTVSRALDGYSDVSEETRQRVIQAAQEMGYVPSFAARQLRRKRSDAIGYILPTSSPRFSDPFYVNFLTGLCDEATNQNIDLMVSSAPPESEKEKEQYRRWVQSKRVDGLILNRVRVYDWRISYLIENQFPFATLGRSSDTTGSPPSVLVDDRSALSKIVMHLAEKGHQHIAYIGASLDLLIGVDRYAGYRQGLDQAGLPLIKEMIIEGDLTEQGGYQSARNLLSLPQSPTAIACCNDQTALGALRAAQEMGITVGEQLAITGYDGIKETEYTNPPLTTVIQPTYEIARTLTSMLLTIIAEKELDERTITIQPAIVFRASSG